MKTKTSAKPSSAKSARAADHKKAEKKSGSPGSKLASLKGAVASAFFGSNAKKNSSAKPAPAAKAPVKGASVAAKTSAKAQAKAAPAKAEKVKPAAPVKTASAAKPGKGQSSAATSKPVKALSRAAMEEICREVACEALSTTGGYCRLHYIKNWKKIKRKELILKEGKLNQYIEELVAKYPDKYIEAIRQDLADDKAFAKVIYDLDLDESVDEFDAEGENVENLIDTIKRDFDDEGEAF